MVQIELRSLCNTRCFLAKQDGLNVERQREELSEVGGLDCCERQGFPFEEIGSQGADGILYFADAWLSV